jgi:MFS family permease
MTPGTIITTCCLVLLSLWNTADGSLVLGALFAGLAVAHLGLNAYLARGRGPSTPSLIPERASPEQRAEIAERQAKVRAGWLRIMIFGWAAAVFGMFVYPPMSVVLAGLSLVASYRYLRCGRILRALETTSR